MTGIPAEMGATLLRTSSLGVSRGRVAVLHDVTVDLQAGEIVAVLGPNGAGKSTLLEALSGQLAATAGAVERIGRIATAMQSPDLARRSVRANVELALAWWGVARPERPSRAAEALTAMGVMDLAERRASSLSGGERRRVHLARALALRPDVLLLDEPFAGLDPQSRGALLDTTRSALRVCAQAVVVVVHDRAEAWALADRVIVMLGGRVVADGAPRDVLERPPSQEVARFLGFTGELREGDEVVLTRPAQVHVGPEGDLAATVKTIVPLEDGARAELVTSRGSLWAVVPYPGPAIGDHVKVRVTGGVRFPCHDPQSTRQRNRVCTVTDMLRIGEVAKALGVSIDTLRRWEVAGRVEFVRRGNQRMLPAAELPALLEHMQVATRKSSARNQLPGTVVAVERDGVMAKVEMVCGDFRVVSLMSREAADDLGLAPGVEATAIIKATNVIINR